MNAARRTPAPGATWLTAWALALAIASAILLATAADGQQLPSTIDLCASAAGCAR